jgi:hypothetical protein
MEDYTEKAIDMTQELYSSDFINFEYSKDFSKTLEKK